MSLSFVGELRVGRQLEGANAMRRQSVRFEDALHRTQAHASRFRQHPTGPVGCIARWRAERQIDHPLHDGGGKRLLAGLARLVAGEPVDTLGHESRLPSPDHGLRFAGPAHDLSGTAALGRRQDDVGAPYMLLRRCGPRRSPQVDGDPSGYSHDNACSHKESLNCLDPLTAIPAVAGGDGLSGEACRRTLPIFDGHQRIPSKKADEVKAWFRRATEDAGAAGCLSCRYDTTPQPTAAAGGGGLRWSRPSNAAPSSGSHHRSERRTRSCRSTYKSKMRSAISEASFFLRFRWLACQMLRRN